MLSLVSFESLSVRNFNNLKSEVQKQGINIKKMIHSVQAIQTPDSEESINIIILYMWVPERPPTLSSHSHLLQSHILIFLYSMDDMMFNIILLDNSL